jgi:hypothetical protein
MAGVAAGCPGDLRRAARAADRRRGQSRASGRCRRCRAALGSTLATYFDGINDGDYASAYDAESTHAHDGESLAIVTANVVTSYDTDLNITSITPRADGSYDVFVTFTSVQASNEGPNGDSCDLWNLDYRLVPGGSGFVIDGASSPTSVPASQSCAG